MNFQEIYTEELARHWNGSDYAYVVNMGYTPETLAAKMTNSLKAGVGNKDSLAIKATCKRLNIKHTYKEIKEYFAIESLLAIDSLS